MANNNLISSVRDHDDDDDDDESDEITINQSIVFYFRLTKIWMRRVCERCFCSYIAAQWHYLYWPRSTACQFHANLYAQMTIEYQSHTISQCLIQSSWWLVRSHQCTLHTVNLMVFRVHLIANSFPNEIIPCVYDSHIRHLQCRVYIFSCVCPSYGVAWQMDKIAIERKYAAQKMHNELRDINAFCWIKKNEEKECENECVCTRHHCMVRCECVLRI